MKSLLRWLVLCAVAALALQIYFVGRIATMAVLAPQSTTFERSEAWRIATEKGALPWRQEWVDYDRISDNLKRAVIASEDDGFSQHDGVDWEALEKAWAKNAKAEQKAEQRASQGKASAKPPKIVGGSTITQQLAKNLFLSGERTLLRKGQEFMLALMLEQLLSKQRILELYLNHVEWGEGVFGAEAAAQHYYRKPASKLTAYESARLAVMLPRPKYFEKVPNSGYLSGRAGTIVARMPDAQLP
ncbi:MAG: monofunctional biosynthetic peptidoglycan transglycosylase [Rhodoferax sp.]|nr:monofunctional biosynthetic peptidoglycan transglycosylase [Rhodoferax sp.]